MRRHSISIHQIPLALRIVYCDRRYLGAALGVALLSAIGLGWAVQLVTSFPGSDLFWDVTPLRLVQVLVLAGTLGLLVPMQVYMLTKGRQMREHTGAGKQRQDKRAFRAVRQTVITVLGGAGGTVLGVACLVCCAPLLIPAVLAFLGTSGMAILSLNVDLSQWSGWLFLLSLVLGFLTLLLVTHNVTVVCRLNPATGRKDPPLRERNRTRERRATERAPVQEV
jgi:hypothetical protein